MSDHEDSGPDTQDAEAQSQANPNSGDQGDKQKADPSLNSQAVTKEDLNNAIGELRETLRREGQSDKDRRFSKIEKGQQTLLDLVTGKMESGMSKSQAMREAKIDMLIADEPENPSKEQTRVTSEVTGDAAKVRASSLLEHAAISEDDRAAILDQVNRRTSFPDEQAIDRLVVAELGKLASKPKASPAQAAQLGKGSATNVSTDTEELQEAYDKAKVKLRPGDVDGLLRLKQEYRKKGLDVY